MSYSLIKPITALRSRNPNTPQSLNAQELGSLKQVQTVQVKKTSLREATQFNRKWHLRSYILSLRPFKTVDCVNSSSSNNINVIDPCQKTTLCWTLWCLTVTEAREDHLHVRTRKTKIDCSETQTWTWGLLMDWVSLCGNNNLLT